MIYVSSQDPERIRQQRQGRACDWTIQLYKGEALETAVYQTTCSQYFGVLYSGYCLHFQVFRGWIYHYFFIVDILPVVVLAVIWGRFCMRILSVLAVLYTSTYYN